MSMEFQQGHTASTELDLDETIDGLCEIAGLVHAAAREPRLDVQQDGATVESVTDHTVLFAVVACSFAEKYLPQLDIGKVAQYVIAHDLPEGITGDIPAFGRTPEQEAEKERQERMARASIRSTIGSKLPWLSETIESYELLDTPEARYVKAFDKLMPPIVHVANHGALYEKLNISTDDLEKEYLERIKAAVKTHAADYPEVLALAEALFQTALEISRSQHIAG